MTETTEQVLIAARLSRVIKDRDQLSIERQDEKGVRRAAELGDDDPIIARDPGVSGSVSPFKRPDLGPYLTDTPPRPWTTLWASDMSRLGRNAADLEKLRAWCQEHGKKIILESPNIQWPPRDDDMTSQIVWVVLEQLAEIELRTTKKRYADTREYLRDKKALMGKKAWGFMIVGRKAAKTLMPDPEKVSYLLRMIEMAEEGKTEVEIAEWLDSVGANPAGERDCTQWDPKSVSQILRNESLYGVRRENGRILLHHQGVISKERWDKLQRKLNSKLNRRGPTRRDIMMLTDAIYCPTCRGIMHGRKPKSRGVPKQHQERDAEIYAKAKAGITHQALADEYKISRQRVGDIVRIYDRLALGEEVKPYVWIGYRCDGKPRQPSKCRNMIPATDIESWVDEWFTIPASAGGSGFADVEILESVYVPAQGHADEIQEIDDEIDDLDKSDHDYIAEVTRLYSEREKLVALGTEPAHTEDQPTGIKLGDYWQTLDDAGKREYLTSAGVKVYASKDERWIEGDPQRVIGALEHKPATA